jgi:hypothetical protein
MGSRKLCQGEKITFSGASDAKSKSFSCVVIGFDVEKRS